MKSHISILAAWSAGVLFGYLLMWLVSYKERRWKRIADKLYELLEAHHRHQSEEREVYFKQDGKPIDISCDLGKAYQESEMCEKTCEALIEYRENL